VRHDDRAVAAARADVELVVVEPLQEGRLLLHGHTGSYEVLERFVRAERPIARVPAAQYAVGVVPGRALRLWYIRQALRITQSASSRRKPRSLQSMNICEENAVVGAAVTGRGGGG
jgi:hypothetical protein